jgi:ribosomal protein L25 (general stress protein Ctc)
MTATALQELDVQERDVTRNPRQLRSAGLIPATLYGGGSTPKNLQVEAHAFTLAYKKGVREFKLGALGLNAKAHQVQHHTTSLKILNIEFLLGE